MTDEQRPQFGDVVEFSAVYFRTTDCSGMITRRLWETRECPLRTGIFLGTRTLYDGTLSYDEYAVNATDTIFTPFNHFQAALVCPNARTNPVYVPLDAFTIPTTHQHEIKRWAWGMWRIMTRSWQKGSLCPKPPDPPPPLKPEDGRLEDCDSSDDDEMPGSCD